MKASYFQNERSYIPHKPLDVVSYVKEVSPFPRKRIRTAFAAPPRYTPLPRFLSLAFFILVCFALPQKAEAQATATVANASAMEGDNISFVISLSGTLPRSVFVEISYTGGTADIDTDLDLDREGLVAPMLLTLTSGTSTYTIVVATAEDQEVEDDETFTVFFMPLELETDMGTSPVTFNPATVTGTIQNDDFDDAEVSIAATAMAAEGSAITFAVNLSAAVPEAVTVRWTATATGDNPATLSGLPSDLGSGQVTTGTVMFSANSTTAQSISVATENDTRVEGSETFTVTLSEDTQGGNSLPTNVTIPAATEAGIATITEDDTAEVSIASTATAAEGSAITFAVNLSAAVAEAVTVRWTATATGTNAATLSGGPSDLGSGQVTTGTVMFSANTTTAQSISVATADDTRVEGSETFTVTLSEDTQGGNSLPTNVTIPETTEAGIATITENDAAQISIASTATAAEGSAVVFTVDLSVEVAEAVMVRWTATATGDNPATLSGASSDLGSGQVTTGTVIFLANTTTAQSISVATLDDDRVEGSETFTVTLDEAPSSSLPRGVTIPETTEAGIATITEDDGAMVSIASTAMAAEGSAITFAVNLSAAVAEAVTVRWTATATGDNPATLSGLPSDLGSSQLTTGTVMFAANTTTARNISIATVNDTRVEGSETFTVTLSEDTQGGNSLPMGVTIPTATEAGIATITEDDGAMVSIASTATAAEGSTITFAVNLSAAVAEAVTVRWTATATGTNAATLSGASSDLGSGQVTTGTVMFSADSTTAQSISVATADDTRVEGSETFTVTLSEDTQGGNSLPTGVTIPEATEAGIATITEDDGAVVSIASSATAEEGSAVVFAVNLSAAVAEAVTVRWTATATGDNVATLMGATSDLGSGQMTTGTVMFQANTTTAQSISLATVDDMLLEEDETFTVTLSPDSTTPLPMGVTIPSATAAGIGTITDNESGESTLIESRLAGAGTALRRHVKRFDSMTGTVIRNRLEGNKTSTLTASQNLKDGAMALGSESSERRMGAWLNGAYARFNGDATGRQADIYGGVDYLGDNNNWLIGALIGYEPVDLDIGEAAYEANYTHFGLYGGMRVSKRLILDGAISYGTATPDIALGDTSASYDADRITVRGGLTGDLGLEYGLGGGSMTVEPQLRILYSRESLDGFIDSMGGIAGSQNLELGRLSAGPRLTWNINGSQVVGSIRAQWDFSDLDDGIDGEVSGAADIGLRLSLAPHVDLGLYGEIDGIGITDEFITYGGRAELNARF